jgi:hypothetical protein
MNQTTNLSGMSGISSAKYERRTAAEMRRVQEEHAGNW